MKKWRLMHRRVALSLSLILLVSALTGVVLTFRKELKAMPPVVPLIWQEEPFVGIQKIIDQAQSMIPAHAIQVELPRSPQTPISVLLDDAHKTRLYFSSGGRLVAQRREGTKTLMQWLFQIHTGAIFGKMGELGMALSGLGLCFCVVSGLIIWPDRKNFFSKCVAGDLFRHETE